MHKSDCDIERTQIQVHEVAPKQKLNKKKVQIVSNLGSFDQI